MKTSRTLPQRTCFETFTYFIETIMPLENDAFYMSRALKLAEQGRGRVEPNPMVGCVLVSEDGTILGEGFHQHFGGNHAEVNALEDAASRGNNVCGAAAFVTLEPCSHYGKTPPCALALIRAGVKHVSAAMCDPFPKVAGGGFQMLQDAGISVSVGTCEAEARYLNAPYLKLTLCRRPWVTAKWAMTLDGKIAARTGSSRWISSEVSREFVHEMRARMDGILAGVGTVLADDPMLNARPNADFGTIPRQALRIVADVRLETPIDSKLVRTAAQIPVLLAVGADVSDKRTESYIAAGCEIFRLQRPDSDGRAAQMAELLDELGRRRLTNLMVEGGRTVFGALLDLREIDEVYAFVAPKLCGGRDAFSPIGGFGLAHMEDAFSVDEPKVERMGADVLVSGRVSAPKNVDFLQEDFNQRTV